MNSIQLRKKFLDFFEKKGHKIVPPSSLLPTDPSVLFTTAGMQQFKEYFLGKISSFGKRVATCQKCLRTSDIEEVGDEKHLTFFEMLGNFSFGDYFKKETIQWAIEFLFKELKLSFDDAIFTVFKGDEKTPFDKDSFEILKNLGIPENKIQLNERKDNFWGPTGKEGPCGPTVEIVMRELEVWNLVFNEYYQDEKGNLTPLKQKGVDTGMGLERLAVIAQKKKNIYETDLFLPIINKIPGENERAKRIIVDHTKGTVFLISEGILPSNVERGYVLRRILRRTIRYGKLLNLPKNFLISLAQKIIEIYKDIYPEVKSKETDILTAIQNEEEKFEKTLERGLKELNKIVQNWKGGIAGRVAEKTKPINRISGEDAFYVYETFGFPLELIREELASHLLMVDEKEFKEAFKEAQKRHREISRAGVEKKFGGVGKEATPESAKLHTATHLLHAALRKILGEHIKQMGSDITPQRLRFDFSHPQRMTAEEIKKVEDLVNWKIKEDLEVKREEMPYKEAIDSGALAFFREKYPQMVTVYSVDDFSREICAGPHVKRTSELGHFKIIKEESSGAGVRRIKAILG